jgi:hypothetical protein
VQKALLLESRFKENRSKHNVAHVQYNPSKSESDEEEVGLVEWSRIAKPVKCSYVKQGVSPGERYDFDETMCEEIFDLPLQEK